MNANSLNNKVIDFVAKETGFSSHDISLQSDLYALGIDGDDAVELMFKFSQEFNVDMSKFDFKSHFRAEGFNPFVAVFSLLRSKKVRRITIADLVSAAGSGVWPVRCT